MDDYLDTFCRPSVHVLLQNFLTGAKAPSARAARAERRTVKKFMMDKQARTSAFNFFYFGRVSQPLEVRAAASQERRVRHAPYRSDYCGVTNKL